MFVPFLSQGYGYPSTSPFHQKKGLEFFKPKISLEEMLATLSSYNRNHKFNINARIIHSCITDSTITLEDVDSLLTGDKQQFLVYLRIFAYTEALKFKLKCTNCENTWDQEYSLVQSSNAKPLKPLDLVDMNLFEVVLPMSKHIVRYKHGTTLDAVVPTSNTVSLMVNEIEETQKSIVSFNDITDKKTIEQSFLRLRVKDSSFLREHYKKTKPEIKITFEVECTMCSTKRVDEMFCNNFLFQVFPENYKEIIYDSFFTLGYYFGTTWHEFLNMPIDLKYFLHERINKEISAKHNDKGEALDIPTKAPHDNTPEIRNLANKTKVFGSQNAKMQRFT